MLRPEGTTLGEETGGEAWVVVGRVGQGGGRDESLEGASHATYENSSRTLLDVWSLDLELVREYDGWGCVNHGWLRWKATCLLSSHFSHHPSRLLCAGKASHIRNGCYCNSLVGRSLATSMTPGLASQL